MSGSWSRMTALDLGRDIGAGRINPVELTEFFLDRISMPAPPRCARFEAMAAAEAALA